jgi:hypothetical protein
MTADVFTILLLLTAAAGALLVLWPAAFWLLFAIIFWPVGLVPFLAYWSWRIATR